MRLDDKVIYKILGMAGEIHPSDFNKLRETLLSLDLVVGDSSQSVLIENDLRNFITKHEDEQ